MNTPYVIRGTGRPVLTIFVCLIFTVLVAVCFWMTAYVYMFAGVFNTTATVTLGIGALMLILALVRLRDIWGKRVTVSGEGIRLHRAFGSTFYPSEGLRLGRFTSRGAPRGGTGDGGLGGVGDGGFRTSGGSGFGASKLKDRFILCAPGKEPHFFYVADAGSAQSSLMAQALNQHIETPIITIKAKPGPNDRFPELGPLRG